MSFLLEENVMICHKSEVDSCYADDPAVHTKATHSKAVSMLPGMKTVRILLEQIVEKLNPEQLKSMYTQLMSFIGKDKVRPLLDCCFFIGPEAGVLTPCCLPNSCQYVFLLLFSPAVHNYVSTNCISSIFKCIFTHIVVV